MLKLLNKQPLKCPFLLQVQAVAECMSSSCIAEEKVALTVAETENKTLLFYFIFYIIFSTDYGTHPTPWAQEVFQSCVPWREGKKYPDMFAIIQNFERVCTLWASEFRLV